MEIPKRCKIEMKQEKEGTRGGRSSDEGKERLSLKHRRRTKTRNDTGYGSIGDLNRSLNPEGDPWSPENQQPHHSSVKDVT
jgi:hypothetical protein